MAAETSQISHSKSVLDASYNPSSLSLSTIEEIDLFSYHEQNAGRLIIDPEEAKKKFGEKTATQLKLTKDGTKILWPQPTDDPNDPQNWGDRRKGLLLLIMTLAAITPDFDSGIGIACIFSIAQYYNTSTTWINDYTSNWSIFLVGVGSLFPVIFIRRYGRLPVLFWTQLLAWIFLIVQTVPTDLNTFAAMRFLRAFFGTASQVTGLYVVSDLYPFHLQPRMLNIWSMGYLCAPFLSPFIFGFVVARASWRWAYWAGDIYGLIVQLLIMFFMEETLYDRTVKPIPQRPTQGLRYRVESLVGITGVKMAKYRSSWSESIVSVFKVIWRPHVISILLFLGVVSGFSIGLNNTNNVLLRLARPNGFGYGQDAATAVYATPLVAIVIGQLIGRYLNEWIMNRSIRRNHGIFESESRLWACYLAIVLYAVGFVLMGSGFQYHMSIAVVIIGWGLAQVAVMICTVVSLAYLNDCFPKHKGEVSSLINLARSLGGFSVAFYQVPWASADGALQTFGVEAIVASSLFLLLIPALQYYGRTIRVKLTTAFTVHTGYSTVFSTLCPESFLHVENSGSGRPPLANSVGWVRRLWLRVGSGIMAVGVS